MSNEYFVETLVGGICVGFILATAIFVDYSRVVIPMEVIEVGKQKCSTLVGVRVHNINNFDFYCENGDVLRYRHDK